MTRVNSANNTDNVPQIILYNRKPEKYFAVASLTQEPDSFKKEQKEETPISFDPNDKFVLNKEDSDTPKLLVQDNKLGASINPKKMKDMFKWGKRIWAGLEIYDTIDGYRERLSDVNNTTES